MNTANYNSIISEKTRREAILFSLRGRMVAYLGSLICIAILIILIIWMMHLMGSFTALSEIYASYLLGIMMFLAFFVIETLNCFFIKNIKRDYIINPLWLISQPTYQEITHYLKHRKEELVVSIKKIQDEATLLQKREEELNNEFKTL
jgi:hypothetical protein